MIRIATTAAVLLLPACAASTGGPSLAPRAAEAIDPRVPVVDAPVSTVADPALVTLLASLSMGVREPIAAFDAASAATQRLVDNAGAPQSESWIEAQQAVSALQALRGPLANALAEIDELAAERIEATGRIAPADLAAIEDARSELGAINDRQAALVSAMTDRLGG
jgi:hypothetical protein